MPQFHSTCLKPQYYDHCKVHSLIGKLFVIIGDDLRPDLRPDKRTDLRLEQRP